MTDQTYAGQLGLNDTNSDVDLFSFLIRQALGRVGTIEVVQVTAVKGGGLNPIGMVDVQPMVALTDGLGNKTEQGIIHNVPYIRLQGGANAVVTDPIVGDKGIAFICSRDISAVKESGSLNIPGSFRRFDPADAIFLGCWSAATPTQYIQFTTTGMTIADMNSNMIVMGPSGINLNGVLIDRTGKITTPADVLANNVSLDNHVHSGVQPGSGETGAPVG